ncbi:hypothetical protein [Nocardia sp. NPDC006630]|uniref:hypothetical protein n=1 Tax=Nocardia sp. NPDC006630 TaxID=3157181 RepID=UPI0033B0C5C4
MRSDAEFTAARVAKARFGDGLLSHPDVHGIGVGRRRRDGSKTDQYAVVVHVARKLPPGEISAPRLLPTELRFLGSDGHEVVVRIDVQEHPKPTPEAGLRVRPVPGGVSAGFSGTLGGWVWDTVTGQSVALSNAHVFGSSTGTPVTQPSAEDGGTDTADLIASVLRSGQLDAAIAAPTGAGVADSSIVSAGPAVFEITDAIVGMRIQKTGRTTGLTFGTVELIDYDSDYFGSKSDLWIDGEGEDFSAGGDSGALYLDAADAEAHRVVGLHWGGSGNNGVGHRIQAVFDDLNLKVLPR